jgi:hypothetical protein
MLLAVAHPRRIVQFVADHPHLDAVKVLVPQRLAGVNFGQVGAIGQRRDRPQDVAFTHPSQQVTTAQHHALPQLIAEEASVPQQQHAGVEVAQQARNHALLAALLLLKALEDEGILDVGADLFQAQLADLGESASAASAFGIAKSLGVGLRIRHVEDRTVDSHQTQVPVEGARSVGRGQQTDDAGEQQTQGREAQTLACLAQGGAG